MSIHVRLLLLSFAATVCGFAQFDSATVLGTVHDPSGSVIANAKITLHNVNTAVTASAITNSDGNYEFLTVKIGDYTVSASAPGFSPVTTEKFNVAESKNVKLDKVTVNGAPFSLKPAE